MEKIYFWFIGGDRMNKIIVYFFAKRQARGNKKKHGIKNKTFQKGKRKSAANAKA